jgi:hypothetical protein
VLNDMMNGEPLRLGQSGVLMIVDGASSALLLTGDVVSLGNASSGRADVPLPGDLLPHHADIVRSGEDFFLHAIGKVEVNGRLVRQVLLREGDRIVLGAKCKMTFSKPSGRSESGVLRFSHSLRLPQDISEILMFRDTAFVGSGPSCHIRMREASKFVAILESEGRLWAQEIATGRRVGPAVPMFEGQTADFGDVRITMKSYAAPRRAGDAAV